MVLHGVWGEGSLRKFRFDRKFRFFIMNDCHISTETAFALSSIVVMCILIAAIGIVGYFMKQQTIRMRNVICVYFVRYFPVLVAALVLFTN